jgi:hypothetical protein
MVVRPNKDVSSRGEQNLADRQTGVKSVDTTNSQQSLNPHQSSIDIQLEGASLSKRARCAEWNLSRGIEPAVQRLSIAEALAQLGSKARACCELPELLRQREVYNSAMVYTEPFDHLVVSRFGHQVHAAAQVAELREVQRRDRKSDKYVPPMS